MGGQLKAGAGAKVKLTYIMELPVEEKCVKLTIPTTIAPRYIPQSDDSESAKEIANLTYNTEGEKGQIPLHNNIDSVMKGKIRKITSPSHTLESEIKELADENGQYLAKTGLGDTTTDVMDRDLVIFIQSEDNSKPVVFVEKSKDSLAALVSLIPSFKLDNQNVELIFLVDRSGSMGGESMNQAKGALELFLHSIPADCYFNIWSFGSRFSSLFENGSKKYDDFTLAEAKNHTNQMTANFGGTEVYKPLEAIFNETAISGDPKQIFLLTDGDGSNDHSVIKLVKDHCMKARVFSLGLGSSASRHLVKGVARAGNGTSIFASLNEDLRPKVLTLLKNALMPSLTNVEIFWNNKKEENSGTTLKKVRTLLGFNKPDKDITSKKTSSPGVLFDGSRMLAFKIFDKDETLERVTITAQAPDGPLMVLIPIDNNCFLTSGKLVHQMAARRQIQDLEENSNYLSDEIKEEISDLALRHSIASKYTSFVGVDKKTRKSILEPAMSSRQIHQEVPLGYGSYDCLSVCSGSIGSARMSMPLSSGGGWDRDRVYGGDRDLCGVVSGSNVGGRCGDRSGGNGGRDRDGGRDRQYGGRSGGGGGRRDGHDDRSRIGACRDDSDDMLDLEYSACRSSRNYKRSKSSEDSDSNSDSDDGWSSNPGTKSSGATPASTDRKSNSLPQKETSQDENLTNLIHLQLADGSFKCGQALENLIGMTQQELMEKCYKDEDSATWITAVAFATLEKIFPNTRIFGTWLQIRQNYLSKSMQRITLMKLSKMPKQ